MKRIVAIALFCILVLFGDKYYLPTAYAEVDRKTVVGKAYELGEEDEYQIAKAQKKVVSNTASRFFVKGEISSVSEHNGFVSYAVSSGNLDVMLHETYGLETFVQPDSTKWHVIADKSKVVDSTKLPQSIGSGAIVVQTSRDGITWITIDSETDFYSKRSAINNRVIDGEPSHTFFRTTNIQLKNGCYYRILVAYKLQKEDSSIVPLIPGKKHEKERLEVYQFYAYDPSVNQAETLDINSAYEFGEVYRVDSQDGFKNPILRESNDPHIDWSVGRFYVSGYTDVRMDSDVPVFLKVPGDRAALWFVLEQELDKCNGDTGIKVNYISYGSDIYFGTPTIANFGRGALIIRRTDKQNQKERQIYTNYLEASATVGANTRVDLFEEGDYEVALDYQLHYDKPFVFGTSTTKTLTYRIFFKFKVRNGDISAFLRDVDTNQFITNANVAPHGFYIDVANSQYLTMTIKREVLSESLDGLVEDTKFSGVAKEGRHYTDEGIYTVTIKNLATGDSVTKRVYVGDQDILLVHIRTGMPISEINERLAAGAYIDDRGQLVDPDPVIEEVPIEEEQEPVEETPTSVISESEDVPPLDTPMSESDEVQEEESLSQSVKPQGDQSESKPNMIVIVSIAAVLLVSVVAALNKKAKKKSVGTKEN